VLSPVPYTRRRHVGGVLRLLPSLEPAASLVAAHRVLVRLPHRAHDTNLHLPTEYAQVIKMLGNGRLEALCFDGNKRLAHIRGKLRKKVWINQGDIILLSLRDYQDEKGDVILKYTADEARSLKAYGELPESAKINETDTYGADGDGDCNFEFDEDRDTDDSDDDDAAGPAKAGPSGKEIAIDDI